mgnify:CR=1 FL=1
MRTGSYCADASTGHSDSAIADCSSWVMGSAPSANCAPSTWPAGLSYLYDFTEGTSGTSIGDGGFDMYDGGNRLSVAMGSTGSWSSDMTYNQQCSGSTSAASIGDAVYSTCKITSPSTGWFASVSSPSASIRGFRVQGNLGCDGGGSARGSSTVLSSGGFYAHWKNVACSYDPSVNHLIISTDLAATHSYASSTDNDQDTVTFSTGVAQVYYVMWAGRSGNSGYAYAQSQFQAVLTAVAAACSTLSSATDHPGASPSPQPTSLASNSNLFGAPHLGGIVSYLTNTGPHTFNLNGYDALVHSMGQASTRSGCTPSTSSLAPK